MISLYLYPIHPHRKIFDIGDEIAQHDLDKDYFSASDLSPTG